MQEARTAIDSLVPAVEGIRTSSREVSRRLAALEHSAHHLSSIDQQQGNKQHSEIAANTGSARRPDDPGHEPRSGGQDPGIPASISNTQPLPNDFETLLQGSRPYSRLLPGFQKSSRSSASNYTGLDSVATGISLSAVSNLSLVSLPISIHEIWKKSHYTAVAFPQYPFSPDQAHFLAISESGGPLSSSGANEDSENTSLSMEILVDCSLDYRGFKQSFDFRESSPLEKSQGTIKPQRKIVLHGIY